MTDRDPVVKGIEKVLSFLPKDLTEEQKAKVKEIEDLLEKIEPKQTDRDER
jgi:hypothetical protein